MSIVGNLSDVCSAVETFEKDSIELYGKCLEFGENIANLSFREIEIFGEPDMEKEEVFIFDTNIIDGIGYPSRPVMGFHTLDELRRLISQRGRNGVIPRTHHAGYV